jgi:hypothetical protein
LKKKKRGEEVECLPILSWPVAAVEAGVVVAAARRQPCQAASEAIRTQGTSAVHSQDTSACTGYNMGIEAAAAVVVVVAAAADVVVAAAVDGD